MPTTLDDIRNRAADLCELEGFDFVDDTQWIRVVNDALRELWSFVLVRNRMVLATSVDRTVTTFSTNYWALPAGHRATIAIERDPGTNTRRFLGRAELLSKNQNADRRLQYWIDSTNLYIEPREQSVGSYRHYYVGSATDFEEDDDGTGEVDTEIEPWAREWCAIRCAMKARVREEASIVELRDRMKELQSEVSHELATRDGVLPRKMVITQDEPRGPWRW